MTGFSASALFNWYDTHGRQLPWRRKWPDLAPAYHVWLSEIMLQQTVVATVIPYFLEFTRRWPTVRALADAPLDDVLAAWAGLGYYARARNLHKAAQMVAYELAGIFPKTYDELLALPGVGPYTAGAISVIAFGQKGVVVDGNIERVMARQFAITTPLPAAKRDIGQVYADVLPDDRPSDFPQALMDFANAVCTVRAPGCTACPLAPSCRGKAAGIVETLPVKAPKKAKELRRGIAFVMHDGHGNAVLVRRPETRMLGGMLGFPSYGWADRAEHYSAGSDLNAVAPFPAAWQLLDAPVQHVFTHFALDMDVAIVTADSGALIDKMDDPSAAWHRVRPASLPTLMRKIWKAAAQSRPVS